MGLSRQERIDLERVFDRIIAHEKTKFSGDTYTQMIHKYRESDLESQGRLFLEMQFKWMHKSKLIKNYELDSVYVDCLLYCFKQ